MSEAQTPRRILRSIAAVFAGLLIIFVLSLATDAVMHGTGVFPPWFRPMSDPLWVLSLAYRCVYAVFGSYVTARMAPNQPMKHALLLGVIGVFLTIVGVATNWNAGPEYGPKWFSIALVLSSLPCAWLGGKLSKRG